MYLRNQTGNGVEKSVSANSEDLNKLKEVLHSCVDDCINYLSNSNEISNSGFFQPPDTHPEIQNGGLELSAHYQQLKHLLFDNSQFLNAHPGFFAWSLGSGLGINLMANLIDATLNCPVQSTAQTMGKIEIEVINWVSKNLFDSTSFSGRFVSGSSHANQIALNLA